MARRTKDEAESTRNAIIDAAEKVFFERGVTRASLEHVAAEAGVTRGAVYWHFKDKPALFEAMSKRVCLPYEDMLHNMVARSSMSPLDDMKKDCLRVLKRMSKDKRRRDVVTIMFFRCEYVEEMFGIIKRHNECNNRMLASSEKMFERARELKILALCWTPRQAATALMALMTGLIMGGLEQRKGFGFTTAGVGCIEAFFNSLRMN